MSQDAFPLANEVLEQFRAALQQAGAPLGAAIGPGLSDSEIERYAGKLGVPVPPELQTLWRWGCPSPDASTIEAGWDINPEYELWTPQIVVGMTDDWRDSDPDLARCIAFAGPPQDGCLIITGDDRAAVSPVKGWYIDSMTPVSDKPILAPSLGVLFHLWTEQLTSADGYTFSGGLWDPEDPLPWPETW